MFRALLIRTAPTGGDTLPRPARDAASSLHAGFPLLGGSRPSDKVDSPVRIWAKSPPKDERRNGLTVLEGDDSVAAAPPSYGPNSPSESGSLFWRSGVDQRNGACHAHSAARVAPRFRHSRKTVVRGDGALLYHDWPWCASKEPASTKGNCETDKHRSSFSLFRRLDAARRRGGDCPLVKRGSVLEFKALGVAPTGPGRALMLRTEAGPRQASGQSPPCRVSNR